MEYAIEQLSPIPEILEYACPPKVVIKPIYNRFLQVQIPILIGLASGFDYCFNGVIRLCQDPNGEQVRYCPDYESLVVKCKPTDARFLIYLVDLNFEKARGAFQGRHAEAVIIDTKEKTIEFFEPNGPSAPWYPLVSSFLESILTQQYPNYAFVSTSDFCPLFGPQGVAKVPLCGAFSLLYLVLRIHNPELSPRQLINIWLELPKQASILIVEALICYADEYAKHYKLRRLQDVYENISSIVEVTAPDLLPEVDRLYLDFNLEGLLDFADTYGIEI